MAPDKRLAYEYQKASAFRDAKKSSRALDVYASIIAENPEEAHALVLQGNLHRTSRKYDEAINSYDAALEIRPGHSGTYYARGLLYANQKKYEDAISDFIMVGRVASEDSELRDSALFQQGLAYEGLDRTEEAIDSYTRGLAVFDDLQTEIQLHAVRADAYVKVKRYEDAIPDYRKVLETAPDALVVHGILAEIFVTLDRNDEAIIEIEVGLKALEEDLLKKPKNVDAMNAFAWAVVTWSIFAPERYARALEVILKGVELSPDDGNMVNTLGVAHFRVGNWDEAIDVLERSAMLSKNASYDLHFLAMAHWHRGEEDVARDYYLKANEWLEKNMPDHVELGRFREEARKLIEGGVGSEALVQ